MRTQNLLTITRALQTPMGSNVCWEKDNSKVSVSHRFKDWYQKASCVYKTRTHKHTLMHKGTDKSQPLKHRVSFIKIKKKPTHFVVIFFSSRFDDAFSTAKRIQSRRYFDTFRTYSCGIMHQRKAFASVLILSCVFVLRLRLTHRVSFTTFYY